MRFGLAFLSSLFSCFVTQAHAEFYEKDFAKAPSGTVHGDDRSLERKEPRAPVGPIMSVPSSSEAVERLSGERLKEIGVLVNGADAQEFLAILETAVKRYPDVKFGPIAIGSDDPNAQLISRLQGFSARGARLAKRSDPVFSGAALSPTWVVGTESGYHLLEGLKDPLVFVNSRAEFIPPERVDVKPTPEFGAQEF
jgi:hypothetical protein